jgi:hypothetical protein
VSRGRGRGPLVLAAAAVGVVVVVAGGLAVRAWHEQQPPALDESGSGTVLRLTRASGGIPPPRVRVQLRNGSSALVSMAGISSRQGTAVGVVMVEPQGGGPGRELELGQGQSAAVGGLTVTVLHVWRMPDGANDAIDVRVLPGP